MWAGLAPPTGVASERREVVLNALAACVAAAELFAMLNIFVVVGCQEGRSPQQIRSHKFDEPDLKRDRKTGDIDAGIA